MRTEVTLTGTADVVAHACDGSWIQTYTGGQVWPLLAKGDINMQDIVHALANICRFGGHTRQFYSVAQHSVLASMFIDQKHSAWGLMHDAAEAYIGDLVRPIKSHMVCCCGKGPMGVTWQSVQQIEMDLLQRIAETFKLPWPAPWDAIEKVDLRLLETERQLLLNPCRVAWRASGAQPIEDLGLLPLSPAAARSAFIRRAYELGLIAASEEIGG